MEMKMFHVNIFVFITSMFDYIYEKSAIRVW